MPVLAPVAAAWRRRRSTVITFPLFLLFAGFVAAVLVKTSTVKGGALVLGVLVGLSLASTAVGPPILSAMTSATTTAVHTISSAVGGRR